MEQNRLVKISKYLSYHLRHCPDKLGLIVTLGGWVEIKQLLLAAEQDNFVINRSELQQVVEQNDKQRFSFDSTKTMIRANQGHSYPVDLQLKTIQPPNILYHGTYAEAVALIEQEGLRKMSRHHVHLSEDLDTAKKVGARKTKAVKGRPLVNPVIFQIDTAAMLRDNYQFYCSENGVWLVDGVPPQYLHKLPE